VIYMALFQLYGDISECEVWPCGMAEDQFEDSLLGESFTYIMAEEFNRMRVSDRLWYDNDEVRARFSGPTPGIRDILPNVIRASIPTSITAITNRNSMAGAPPTGNVFQLRPFWTSYRLEDEFGVEWFTPSNIAATTFTQYIVRVTPPLMDGASQFIVNRGEIQATRITEAVNPNQLYNVALLVNFPSEANPTLVGETVVNRAVILPPLTFPPGPTVVPNTAMPTRPPLPTGESGTPCSEEGEGNGLNQLNLNCNNGGPLRVGNLGTGAVIGIIVAGFVFVVVLIVGVVLYKKRSNKKQFEENAQTFL